MNKNMQISERGICRLKQFEGCVKINNRHVIYDDATGQPVPNGTPLPPGATIGYGHLITPDQDFTRGLTEEQATKLLQSDLTQAQDVVRHNVHTKLTQYQYDALVILAFNIGAGAFRKSTVLKYLNIPGFVSKKYPTLMSAWLSWCNSGGRTVPGLLHRRRQEWEMFINQ